MTYLVLAVVLVVGFVVALYHFAPEMYGVLARAVRRGLASVLRWVAARVDVS
jgi:hypothetical protein